jgi:hypothetical protein
MSDDGDASDEGMIFNDVLEFWGLEVPPNKSITVDFDPDDEELVHITQARRAPRGGGCGCSAGCSAGSGPLGRKLSLWPPPAAAAARGRTARRARAPRLPRAQRLASLCRRAAVPPRAARAPLYAQISLFPRRLRWATSRARRRPPSPCA